MPDILWEINSLAFKENTLFVTGWLFHKTKEVVELRFRLSSGTDAECITAEIGIPRPDVAESFSDSRFASNCGFLVLGAFSDCPTDMHLIVIDCVLADGTRIAITTSLYNRQSKFQRLSRIVRKVLVLLLKAEFRALLRRKNALRNNNQKTLLRRPEHLAELLLPDERNNVVLIVDHNLGGGANRYRERLVQSVNSNDGTAIVLTYDIATLTHLLLVQNGRINLQYLVPSEDFFFSSLSQFQLVEIIFNNGVSFTRPDKLLRLILDLKRAHSAPLKILMHDYFLVCPSQYLLDRSGNYCGIPEVSICSGCLKANRFGFTTLFAARDLPQWRNACREFLTEADEIRAFSNDTVSHLVRAYPNIDQSRISVKPHIVKSVGDSTLCQVRNTERLCIGVVGHIAFHKGAKFIQSLADEITRRDLNIKIEIIGTLAAYCDSLVITQTGSYQSNQLPSYIEQCGANVMLFPSICPETFSYVTQELIELDIPIACFNLGAPAERLRSYSKGLVLDTKDPPIVLDQLLQFHSVMYLG